MIVAFGIGLVTEGTELIGALEFGMIVVEADIVLGMGDP